MTYEELDALLRRAGAESEAAEVHGSLCGQLCAVGETCLDQWLNESLQGTVPEDALAAELGRALVALHQRDAGRLSGGDPGFAPLLPDDGRDLQGRATALGGWCQGFVQGLALGRVPDPATLERREQAPHTAEVVTDFTEIARAGFSPEGEDLDPEQAEEDYGQLVEYARVGAQLVFEELTSWRARASSGGQGQPAP